MNLRELLLEILALGAYDAVGWKEYVGYFDGCEDLAVLAPQSATVGACDGEPHTVVLERIRQRKGAGPARLVPDVSPKIVTADFFRDPNVRSPMTLGVVSGAYDLLHLGHMRSMVFAKKALAEHPDPILCVMTISDEAIRTKKGPARPTLDFNERVAMLCGVRCVDYVIALTDPNCLAALKALRPEFFFKESRDDVQEIVRQEKRLVESEGGRVVTFPPDEGPAISTTDLIQAVLRRTLSPEQANAQS